MANWQRNQFKKIKWAYGYFSQRMQKFECKEDQWASEIHGMQTLVSRFNMRVFQFVAEKLPKLLAARLNISKWIFEVWSFITAIRTTQYMNRKCGVFMFTLASRVTLGEANSVCRSLLVAYPACIFFLVSISARTNSSIQLFLKRNLFGRCNTIF